MNAVVYVNGQITDASAASVPVFDHGFLYGEGVYETLRTYGVEPFLFDRHTRRLRNSAALMELPVPFSDADLLGRVKDTIAAHSARRSAPQAANEDPAEKYIRILLTRGVGELTYQPDACPTPTLVIIVKPLTVYPERTFTDGIRLALVGIRRNHPKALNPLIKSNNLLNNALAMQEALKRHADEALMLNQAGEIVECSQSNFFLVQGGVAMTPPLSAGLLPGITREVVLELAAELQIPAREATLTPDDLRRADEAFITGTTREITPVTAIDDLRIGTGQAGAITLRLLQHFRQRVPRVSVRT